MGDWAFHLRRRIRATARNLRELRLTAYGAVHTDHPIMAAYHPDPTVQSGLRVLQRVRRLFKAGTRQRDDRRINRLADLGTTIVTLSGGEPLLHPELDDIITAMRRRGVIAGMITNGYLLTADRVKRLNQAGLDHMQISIDNVMPDDVSKKSLKVLDRKLQILADNAEFHVNINSVVGGGTRNPDDALVVGKRAIQLGFSSTIGIIHDGEGQLQPLKDRERAVYREMKQLEKRHFTRLNFFQDAIADGRPNDWKCRAGARYLYVCEDGLVHYCSQQRGYPAKPLDEYTVEDIRREYVTEKSCAPYCTVSCVHYISYFDFWRGEQTIRTEPQEQRTPELVQISGPATGTRS